MIYSIVYFFFQAEDGIRDLVRSRGLGDVYKRQRLRIDYAFARDVFDETGQKKWSSALYATINDAFLSLIHI